MPMLAMPKARRQSIGHIGLVGVTASLDERLNQELGQDYQVTVNASAQAMIDHLESGGVPFDAALLDMGADDAVRLAQRLHTYDKLMPILLLGQANDVESLQRALMFSPFLGNEVTVWSRDDADILPSTLRDAVARHRQRVHHMTTLSMAQIRLEKLPLQRPEATHYLDRLLDCAPVGVMTVDTAGTVVTLNRQAQQLLDSRELGILGKPLSHFFPPSERQRLDDFQASCNADMSARHTEVFELRPDPGARCYIEVSGAPLSYRTGQRGFMLILQDVTSRIEAEQERQRAESDLRHHAAVLRRFHEITSSKLLSLEEKLDAVLELGCEQFRLEMGLLTRADGERLTVIRAIGDEPAYQAGTQHDASLTYCGMTLNAAEPIAVAHPAAIDWRPPAAALHGGQQAYIGNCVQIDDDTPGTLCFFSRAERPGAFNTADSELIKLMSRWIGSELQRERADALMRKLSGALERTADAIMITDRDRHIEYVNPSFERLTGYRKEEAIGKKTYFLRSGLHDHKFYDELWEVIGKGEVYRGTMVNRKKDGSLYYERKTISPLRDEKGAITHFISTGHDITELIHAEEKNRAHQAELAHVARLSTLGEMTSGLAHELNQPLCAITTYAQTCLHILQNGECDPERVRYGVTQIVKQAELASEIFRRLRNFARKGEIQRQPVSIDTVMREVIGFVSAEAQQKLIRLHHSVSDDLATVLGDAIQIEQVLLNLVRNAMEAVLELPEPRRKISISGSSRKPGWITVEIRDSGPGCPQAMAERLFEPFVTSKDDGLGIGLSISQGIIEAHGGSLWLAENSSQGAVFAFTLPVDSPSHEQPPVT